MVHNVSTSRYMRCILKTEIQHEAIKTESNLLGIFIFLNKCII